MDQDRPEQRLPGDAEVADELKMTWGGADDRWDEVLEGRDDHDRDPGPSRGATRGDVDDVPWDDLAEDGPPQFVDDSSFVDRASKLVPDSEDDESGLELDDEESPHGDPLDDEVDDLFEGDQATGAGAGPRMDSLQDALASIRDRVQSLSSTVQGGGPRAAQSSQLALYRAATDDRTYAELRRHSHDTEEHLRRMSSLMQDLSLDLRSIVDAARRAIDQTSEQAESSIELGRLLGERIEQMDEELSTRIDRVIGKRIDQIDAAVGSLQVALDKRLTKLEQRAGVGMLREDLGELRTDVGEVRADLASMRDEMGAAAEGGGAELQERLAVVGSQLDRTVASLRDLVEGSSDQEADVVEGVMGAIKAETESAVEPFRAEVEQLGQLLTDALGREEQMGSTLATLTDEVQRLRKRIAVRAGSPSIDDDQIQSIVDAVVVAVQGRRQPSTTRRRAAKPEPPVEADDEAEDEVGSEAAEPEPEPAPRPLRTPRKKRERPVRAKKAPPVDDDEPEYELDINTPFGEGELDLADAALDVEPEEEPIRRARGDKQGTKKRATRPLSKGRRTRSSPR